MARFAIGDIQGCFTTFRRLVRKTGFRPGSDELWIAGDFVNRGPGSLDVLLWLMDHDASVRAVIGNHEIHLLARHEGIDKPKAKDTLDTVLEHPQAEDMIRWVQGLPLLIHEEQDVMVHAGLLPQWTLADANRHARAVENDLRGERTRRDLLAKRSAMTLENQDDEGLFPFHARVLKVLTGIRICDAHGRMHTGFSAHPSSCPEGYRPWFAWPHQRPRDSRVVFGHWAALGFHRAEGVLALDTGCVWGRELTAVRLEDGAIFTEQAEK